MVEMGQKVRPSRPALDCAVHEHLDWRKKVRLKYDYRNIYIWKITCVKYIFEH